MSSARTTRPITIGSVKNREYEKLLAMSDSVFARSPLAKDADTRGMTTEIPATIRLRAIRMIRDATEYNPTEYLLSSISMPSIVMSMTDASVPTS